MLKALGRSSATFVGVAVMLVAAAGTAWADCESDENPINSSSELYSAGAGNQFAGWNSELGNGASTLEVNTNDIGENRCLDVWHDWATTGGHYDARVVRVCKDDGTRDNTNADGDFDEPNVPGRNLTGQNRGGACVYDFPTFVGACEQTPQAERNPGCLVQDSADHPNNGVRPNVASYNSAMMWIRYGTGSHGIVNQNSDPASASS
jgi:hypothetical protein